MDLERYSHKTGQYSWFDQRIVRKVFARQFEEALERGRVVDAALGTAVALAGEVVALRSLPAGHGVVYAQTIIRVERERAHFYDHEQACNFDVVATDGQRARVELDPASVFFGPRRSLVAGSLSDIPEFDPDDPNYRALRHANPDRITVGRGFLRAGERVRVFGYRGQLIETGPDQRIPSERVVIRTLPESSKRERQPLIVILPDA